jgi:NADH-quinone oxidoreductase subunit E
MSAVPETEGVLSAEAYRRIDRELAKYPPQQKRSAVLAGLVIAQGELGWLPPWAIEAGARYWGIPQRAAWAFRFCARSASTNLPCALSGANRAAARLKERLGIDFGETSADGQFTLKEGECFGACGDAPVLLVNNRRMCSFLNDEKLDELLEQLRRGEGGDTR